MTMPSSPPPDLSKLRINRDEVPPRVQGALRRNVILFIVALAVIWGAVRFVQGRSVPTVQVVTISAPGSGVGGPATSVTANGYVVARTKASVSAKIPGRLAFLSVSEGSYVRKGVVIARLDNAEFEAAVTQAEAGVASMEASQIEAAADRDQLVREAKRQRDIHAQNPNLISQSELDVAESQAARAEARMNAAAARTREARAALQLARANNDNTIIRAPFTGTVLRKDAEVGEVVAPSVGGGLTRGAVVTMADLTTLEVEVDVNESYIARIKSGLPARITLDAYADTSFRGTVRQVVPTADRQRATVQVKVSIDDDDPRILPEMGAKVDFLEPDTAATDAAPAPRPLVRVPQAAVREEAGRSVVWLVRDERLTRREIEAGPVSAGFREVRAGLSGGEQLLIGGVESPTEGMRVKIGS